MLMNSANLNLDADLVNAACDAFDVTGAFSQANPSTPLSDNPHVQASDRALRAAFTTKNVVWSCSSCGRCYVRVRAPRIASACCDATLRVDAPRRAIEKLS